MKFYILRKNWVERKEVQFCWRKTMRVHASIAYRSITNIVCKHILWAINTLQQTQHPENNPIHIHKMPYNGTKCGNNNLSRQNKKKQNVVGEIVNRIVLWPLRNFKQFVYVINVLCNLSMHVGLEKLKFDKMMPKLLKLWQVSQSRTFVILRFSIASSCIATSRVPP